MTPPFACVPICFFFTALALVGVLAYLAGAGFDRPEAGDTAAPAGRRIPWWVFPAVLLAAVISLLLLSLVTDG